MRSVWRNSYSVCDDEISSLTDENEKPTIVGLNNSALFADTEVTVAYNNCLPEH